MSRRLAFVAALLAAALALTGCSPDDLTAVTRSTNGLPALVNCGTYLRDIEAYDADSGRLVWSAGQPEGSTESGVGEVEIGVLPAQDWVVKSQLQMEPAPTRWRFVVVNRSAAASKTVEVADNELSVGQVLIFGSGKTQSSTDFRDDTCGYGSPSEPRAIRVIIMIVLGGPAAVFLIGTLFLNIRRRRSTPRAPHMAELGGDVVSPPPLGTPPAGWYPGPGQPGVLRWWNGVQWTEHRATPPQP